MTNVIIKSKNPEFILRHVTKNDAQGYFESMYSPEAKKGFMSTPQNLKEAKKKIQEYISQTKRGMVEPFTIEVNGQYAGYVELHDLGKEHFKHRAYIGYCLHPNFRGKGIMTEAVKLVSSYAFKKYKLKRLEAYCRTFNKPSAKVLKKSGFKLEGILRKNKCKDGKYLDDMVWAIVK